MSAHDEVRDAQRSAWAGLSAGWARWDDVIMDQLGPVTTTMIERLGIDVDQHHLDVASGTGEPGLAIAEIATDGRVVLTDLAPEMLEIARRRAGARGIANVEAHVCSADDLPFDDATFDSVSIRFGYMFLPDLAAATSELVRVLRPGGRLCASVWIRPEDNPWTSIVMNAIAAEHPLPTPDPEAPSMFRCAEPGRMRRLFSSAGLHAVEEADVGVQLVTSSTLEYWQMIGEHLSLAAAALARVDDAARERIGRAVMQGAAEYEADGVVGIPGLARCTWGTR